MDGWIKTCFSRTTDLEAITRELWRELGSPGKAINFYYEKFLIENIITYGADLIAILEVAKDIGYQNGE